MPILASSMYVNAYGKPSVVSVATANTLDSSQASSDTFVVKYNSSGTAVWSARIASVANDISYGITTDSNGNVYVTGNSGTNSSVSAYNSDGTAFTTTLPNAGSNDAFIVKYDSTGIVQWVARIASSGADIGYELATDSSGNVYVTGQGGGVVTAYNSNGTAFGTTLANAGGTDAFIVKYDSGGSVIWVAKIASTAGDIGYAIATDSSGNVYVTGQGGSGVVTAYGSNGTAFGTTLPNAGSGDAFIVKYDSGGSVIWVARIASTASDFGYAITTDSSNNIYVTGQGSGVMTTYNANGTAFGTTLANIGISDAFIVKYNDSGAVQWVARLASVGNDIGYGIGTDSSGNVYVTGRGGSNATVTAYNSNGTAFGSVFQSNGLDAFIVKYNTSGMVQWLTRVSSANTDIGWALTSDSTGNVYITGQFTGRQFSVYGQSLSVFSTVTNTSGSDTFIVKYNTNGTPQWVARIAGSAASFGYAIATDSSGNVYVTGQGGSGAVVTAYSSSGTAFGTTLANAGSNDAFIVKYDSDGSVVWVARIASTATDIGYAIATDSSGNVYVTGQGGTGVVVTAYNSNGTAFGTTLTNAGGTDAFIVKYDSSGSVVWVARIASTVGDIGYAIATDSSGNVYVTGQGGTGAVVTAYSSSGTAFGTTIANAGNNDAFIVKYDSGGSVVWVARIASSLSDIGYAIATDSSGNVYVTGQGGSGVVTVYSSNGTAFGTTLPNAGGGDAFIVKYDSSGFVQWVARVASTSADRGYGIATDSNGNIYVTGQAGATATVYNSNGTAFGTTLSNFGGGDAFVAKYNTNGTVLWVGKIASNLADIGFAIDTDSSGNVYITGTGGGLASIITVYDANGMTPFSSMGFGFTVKLDTNGFCKWIQRVAGSLAGAASSRGLSVDSSANCYVTGQMASSQSLYVFNVDNTVYKVLNSKGGNDVFIVKHSSNTTPLWVAQIASTVGDTGYAIATDSSGNVYVTGQGGDAATVTAYNSNGTAFGTLSNAGSTDVFIVKYDSGGSVVWVARIASTGSDFGYAIATDSSGNVYVTGQGGDSVTVTAYNSNGTAFGTTLANAGSNDAFIVKYDSGGSVVWVARIASTTGDIGYAIATDSSGNVYVTGAGGAGVVSAYSSTGTAFGTTLANVGFGDAFIVKYNASGTVQWVAKIASIASDIGYAIATDSNGNVYVTGQGGTNATVVPYSSNGNSFGAANNNAGGTDVFVVKYNSSGDVQWIARISSTADDIGYAIATDSGGNVYVTGQGGADAVVTAYSSNATPFGTTLTNAGGTDAFVVKYNTSGTVQWVAKITSTGSDIGYAIDTDSSGNVYISGQSGSGVTISAYNADTTLFGSTSTTPTGFGNEVFMVKYNTDGLVQWISQLSGGGNDIARGIAIDSSTNIYTIGVTDSSTLIPYSA